MFMTNSQEKFQNPIQSVLVVLLVVAAFLIGSLWTKVKTLEGNSGIANKPAAVAGKVAGEAAVPTSANVEPMNESDYIRGDKNAQVQLIDYSDTECPFCKQFHATIQQTIKEYDGKVVWVYRHFPLDMHPKAKKEAEATECAGALGGVDGFWKLLDKIYEVTPSNNGLNLDDLPSLATQVGLNATAFKECLDSGKYAKNVTDDIANGTKVGVSGTPAAFLYDTKTKKTTSLPGAVPAEQLKASIDAMLKK